VPKLPTCHPSRQEWIRPTLTPLKRGSLGPHESDPNGISISSAVFVYTTANDPSAFKWARQLPFPLRDRGPYLIQVSLGSPNSASKRHLDQFSRFCRVHECDQQTDTRTHGSTTMLLCLKQQPASNAMHVMLPNNRLSVLMVLSR